MRGNGSLLSCITIGAFSSVRYHQVRIRARSTFVGGLVWIHLGAAKGQQHAEERAATGAHLGWFCAQSCLLPRDYVSVSMREMLRTLRGGRE
eukprot:678393-Rhodomonas_salina.2